MGGWVAVIGDDAKVDERLSRFRHVFSVSGVPGLRLQPMEAAKGIEVVRWAWNVNGVPDVYVHSLDGKVLVLSGAITGLGRFGDLPGDQDRAALEILKLWILHGEEVIEQLNGSFSCVFYDRKSQETAFYTDRFASRSLWIAEGHDVWIAGNFPSAVAAVMDQSPKINPSGLWSLLYAARHPGCHGIYSGFRCLLAGQAARLSPGKGLAYRNWWTRKYRPYTGMKPSEWGRELADALRVSGTRYMNICRRPYLFLSGGLDSRIAAGALEGPLKAISLYTSPNAESHIASWAADIIGIESVPFKRSPSWHLETFEASALIGSGNHLNHHTHFIKPVSQIVTEDGFPEFFLGDMLENFNKHYYRFSGNAQTMTAPESISDFIQSNVPYTIKRKGRLGIHIRPEVRKKIEERYRHEMSEFGQMVSGVSEHPGDVLDTLLRWADVSLTPTYNMITCIWPLASERNIALDNDLNDLSLGIPSDMRGAGILHKETLKSMSIRLALLPDANSLLPPVFPEKLKKMAMRLRPIMGGIRRAMLKKVQKGPVLATSGSWLLLHEMYRNDPEYRAYIEKLLFDEEVFPPDIFDNAEIRRTWDAFRMGDLSLEFEIEALISFGSIHRRIPCGGIEISN